MGSDVAVKGFVGPQSERRRHHEIEHPFKSPDRPPSNIWRERISDPEQAHPLRWWTLATLCLTLVVISIDNNILNVAPDLSHFDGIIPCGLPDFAVTSLRKLGCDADMPALDSALLRNFPKFINDLGACNKNA